MGKLRVYNTLSKCDEEFTPISSNVVNMFVCGPTVYDYPHLGHAKTYTQFDLIVRYLRFKGYNVFYLQNITDIDNKIIDRSIREGIPWYEVARQYQSIYQEDMQALHNVSVSKYAPATDYIEQMVNQVQRLIDRGYAYTISDGIYFEISKFQGFGKLSGRTEVSDEDGVSRIDENPEKRGRNDFCLWKFSKPGEPVWETSIGVGRPGWHIEDTAITETHFGPQYDLHGGGRDLIIPHHEAEIAQMEAASGKEPLVRYWMHTGFLTREGKKESKSKPVSPKVSQKVYKTIRDALQDYNYRVLRYLFLTAHYRSPIDFTDPELVFNQAQRSLNRIDEFIFNIDSNYDDLENTSRVEALREQVYNALDDDFSTPQATAAIFDFIRVQNTQGKAGTRVFNLFRELNQLFDFMEFSDEMLDSEIALLISEREKLRAKKDFVRADTIRDQLLHFGIQTYDTPDGMKWRRIKPSS